jgi:hypothetical protein
MGDRPNTVLLSIPVSPSYQSSHEIITMHSYIKVCVMLLIEDPTMTVKHRTAIKTLFLYFNLCLCVKLDSLPC